MRLPPLLLTLMCACSDHPMASTPPSVHWELGVASFAAGAQWRDFQIQVPTTGRYRCEIEVASGKLDEETLEKVIEVSSSEILEKPIVLTSSEQ